MRYFSIKKIFQKIFRRDNLSHFKKDLFFFNFKEIHKRIMETDNFDFNGQGCSNNSNNSSKDEPEVIELD